MNILNIVLCYLLITINAYADGSHASHSLEASGADKVGSASISTLNLEIEVTDGYGRGFFFETATNKEEELINQGYASLNVFHYVDAYRSFKTAYHLNHKSIFALVGMSFAVLTQDTGANGAKLAALALNDAHKVALASNPSEKEAAWLKFSKFFYLMKIGNSNLLDDQEAIDGGETFQNLAKVDGENLEFKTFIHWVLLNNSNSQYIKSVLESVLVSEPNHAGAHHYLLHLFEMTHDIAAARKHAEVLITLALGSAHAQHMYGHTLPQTGEWDEALKQFLIADKIHHDWAASNGVDINEDWHYAHNLDLLAATYLGLGDYENALANWSKSMMSDARAIQKVIGLALATDQLTIAQDTLDQIEGMGPQYKNFVSFLRSEEAFYSSNTMPSQFPATPFAQLLKKTYQKTGTEEGLSAEYQQFFGAKFRSGGFDGWSNGFVELMRAKNIARELGLSSLESSLTELEDKARTGQL